MTTANTNIKKGLENALFDVQKVKSENLFKNYVNGQNGQKETITFNSGSEYSVLGTLPNGSKKFFGMFGENYFLMSPKMVFDGVSEWLDKSNLKFKPNGYIDGNGNFQIRFIYDDGTNDAEYKGYDEWLEDKIQAGFKFTGSICGGQKLAMNGFLNRLICSNGMTTPIESEIFIKQIKHSTKRINQVYGGINFNELMPQVLEYMESFDLVKEHQKQLQDQKIKESHILPFFYEVTKGTQYPQSKFQDAYNRMQFEASKLGYTALNKYLAYAGLNYILEHDSAGLTVTKREQIDRELCTNISEFNNIGYAVKNFNAIAKAESTRIETYQTQNNGKNPRGKRKILELDTVPMEELVTIYG